MGQDARDAPHRISCVLLDLDDTLYRVEEMPRLVLQNIQAYMEHHLGIPRERIPELSQDYYFNFGTTLAGLVANNYKIDFKHWHAHVHAPMPYERLLLREDFVQLRALLTAITLPKYVFTNADDEHAYKCLELMGLTDVFDGVITFESIQEAAERSGAAHHKVPVVCKPVRRAFELAAQLAGGAIPSECIFFDDSARNVAGARNVGMFSVLVGRTNAGSAAHAEVENMLDVPRVLPGVWRALTARNAAERWLFKSGENGDTALGGSGIGAAALGGVNGAASPGGEDSAAAVEKEVAMAVT